MTFEIDNVLEELKTAYYTIRRGHNCDWKEYDLTETKLLVTQPPAKQWLEKAQWWYDISKSNTVVGSNAWHKSWYGFGER